MPLTTQEDQSDSQSDSISQVSDLAAEMQLSAKSKSLAKTLLREPKRTQFDSELATWVNKHLALELYFAVIGNYLEEEEL